MKKLVLVLAFCFAPGLAASADLYDDRVGDGSVPTTCASADKLGINARAVCVENLSTSTDAVFIRCDATPVIGSGATLRRGLEPGEKTCFDGSGPRHYCRVLHICADGSGVATYVVRYVSAAVSP